MECVEAFLDDFAVDDLLDFSVTEGFERDEAQRDEHEPEEEKDSNFSDQSVCLEDFLSFPGAELQLPVGDLEELEWLSNFVEDSFSESYISGDLTVNPKAHTAAAFARNPVPVKPRTKRSRTSRRVWSLPPPSSSSSTAAADSPSDSSPETQYQAEAKVGRKRRRRAEAASIGGGGGQRQRRCSHCGVQRTPQWRMGPLGEKTLCNACGVRFKSGRLLPEYRPACSPTFSTDLHSNSHRKVLELRLQKAASTGRVGSNPA